MPLLDDYQKLLGIMLMLERTRYFVMKFRFLIPGTIIFWGFSHQIRNRNNLLNRWLRGSSLKYGEVMR
jgi:hypothetical protein